MKKTVEKAAAGASQEVRIVKIVKPAAEQSTAVKADAADQFKATEEKSESSVAESVPKHETVQK